MQFMERRKEYMIPLCGILADFDSVKPNAILRARWNQAIDCVYIPVPNALRQSRARKLSSLMSLKSSNGRDAK